MIAKPNSDRISVCIECLQPLDMHGFCLKEYVMEDKKSYFAVIPANVRYDNELPASAKLLYGEITALCNEKGFCWAKNEYFSELYQVSEKTIKRWIGALEKNDYISSKIEKIRNDDGTVKTKRTLMLRGDKNVPNRGDKNVPNRGDKNVPHNNTSINNTNTNNNIPAFFGKEKQADELFEKLWKEYPNKKGKADVHKTNKLELLKFGYEKLSRAIKNYDKSVVDKKFLMYGSRFFKTGFLDYLETKEETSYSNIRRL